MLLAEQVMEVFTEKEEQAQQLTGRCPSLLEATTEELIILLDAEPIGRRKSKSWQESSVMPLCIAHITTAYSACALGETLCAPRRAATLSELPLPAKVAAACKTYPIPARAAPCDGPQG